MWEKVVPNNCPYNRRFNWFKYIDNDKFDYNMNDDYGKMVLNPDVVVRSRGVIEKCSMCIQKIQKSNSILKNRDQKSKIMMHKPCSSVCSTNGLFLETQTIRHKFIIKK